MVKVGVVGAGGIGVSHGKAWNALGAELWVYAPEGADAFAEQFGATSVPSMDELLAQVDIVDVITPTPAHAAIIEQALRAGKDVICEKPITRHVDEGEALGRLAHQLGRTIYPAHVVRWFPQYAAAKRAIDDGRLGQLAVLRFTRTGSFPTRGWFADHEQSGGIAMDLMIHDLDQAVWMAGPPHTVHAVSNQASEPDKVQSCLVTMTHPGQVISQCRGWWGPQGTPFSYSFHLSGTGGVLRYDSREATGFRLSTSAATPSDATTVTFDDPYVQEIADFAAAFAGGPPPRVSLLDGLTAVRVAEAVAESVRTGQPVTLAEPSAAPAASTSEVAPSGSAQAGAS